MTTRFLLKSFLLCTATHTHTPTTTCTCLTVLSRAWSKSYWGRRDWKPKRKQKDAKESQQSIQSFFCPRTSCGPPAASVRTGRGRSQRTRQSSWRLSRAFPRQVSRCQVRQNALLAKVTDRPFWGTAAWGTSPFHAFSLNSDAHWNRQQRFIPLPTLPSPFCVKSEWKPVQMCVYFSVWLTIYIYLNATLG